MFCLRLQTVTQASLNSAMPGTFFYNDPPPSFLAGNPTAQDVQRLIATQVRASVKCESEAASSRWCVPSVGCVAWSWARSITILLVITQTTSPTPPKLFTPITNGCQARCGEHWPLFIFKKLSNHVTTTAAPMPHVYSAQASSQDPG